MHLREYLQLTDSLSDTQFESLFAQACRVRSARNEAMAIERAMHTATGGISSAWAERNSPEGRKRALVASYAAAGLTPSQINTRLRELAGR